MGKGKRYDNEPKLNYTKVFAVAIAIIVLIIAIIAIKNILTKAKNTKPLEIKNYFAVYQDEKWGILGSDGEMVIEPMYQEMPIVIDSSKDIFLCTYDINEEEGTYKTKVINSKNEEIWTKYDKVESLENYDKSGNVWYEKDVLKVQKDGKWGLITLNGNEISEIIYDDIKTLKGVENSIIVEKDGNIGLLNNKGIKIADTEYSQIFKFGEDYKNGYITVNKENKYGLISLSGEKILENNQEKIEEIYSDKYGLMDFEGNTVIQPTYEELKEINSDVFSAKKDGKTGVIDKEQNEKIAFLYQDINYNKKAGIYIADDENYKSTLLDTNFEIKLMGILSEINTDTGYMKLKIDDNYKYYNFKFEEKKVQDILLTSKLFIKKENGKYGFVDSKGNKVVDYIYDDATEFNKYGYAAVKKDGLWGSINSEGNLVIEPTYNLEDNLIIDFIGKWHLGLDLNMNYYCDK